MWRRRPEAKLCLLRLHQKHKSVVSLCEDIFKSNLISAADKLILKEIWTRGTLQHSFLTMQQVAAPDPDKGSDFHETLWSENWAWARAQQEVLSV